MGIGLTAAITQWVLRETAAVSIPWLVAPMGASAVLLFAVPASPLAQPWSIMGGNLVSATIGVSCAYLFADPVVAAALAVSLSIAAMFALRCIHPPSGAVALTAVLGGPALHDLGYLFVLEPIALQSALLLLAAIIYHAVTGHRYPHRAPVAAKSSSAKSATPVAPIGFTRDDLNAVLKSRSELLDIDPGDLESVIRDVQAQALSRSISALSCAQIMSPNVISVTPQTSVQAALKQLMRHRVKALPVMGTDKKLLGIVTRADIAAALVAGNSRRAMLAYPLLQQFGKLRQLGGLAQVRGRAKPSANARANAGQRVADVMSKNVLAVKATEPARELFPLFANSGHHHIPVVDDAQHVVGMVTQVDLIASLHRLTQEQ